MVASSCLSTVIGFISLAACSSSCTVSWNFCSGHLDFSIASQLGPCFHRLLCRVSLAESPRVHWSDGLSFVSMCIHWCLGVDSWISRVLLATHTFCFPGSPRIHDRAIDESVQKYSWSSVSSGMACLIFFTNLAESTAPSSSSRGRRLCSSDGATLHLAAMKLTVVGPSLYSVLRYAAVEKANGDASEKM